MDQLLGVSRQLAETVLDEEKTQHVGGSSSIGARRPLDAAGSTIRDCDLDPVGQRESLDLVRGCGPDTLIFVHGCTPFDWFFDPPRFLRRGRTMDRPSSSTAAKSRRAQRDRLSD